MRMEMFHHMSGVPELSVLSSPKKEADMKKRCIAMAYKKRPLDRIAVEETERLIYILSPDAVNSVDDSDDGAVGFPKEFVFEADDNWLSELESAFDSRDNVRLDSLWLKGRPLTL